LPRASVASTTVERRGPGHLFPCGVFSRQARHTRSRWASSQASGGPTLVDNCTERKWDTNDCRQLHPVAEPPSRRAQHDIWKNQIPEGWVEAVVRGRDRAVLGLDGSRACPSAEGSSIAMGPVAGSGASRAPACASMCTSSGSVSIGATAGSRRAYRVSPSAVTYTGSGSVAIWSFWWSSGAGPSVGGSRLRWGIRTGLRRLPPVKEPCRGGGSQRRRAGSGGRPCGRGAAGWPRGVKALHVPPAFHIPGPTSEGQHVRVAVCRHELGARVRAPGCLG